MSGYRSDRPRPTRAEREKAERFVAEVARLLAVPSARMGNVPTLTEADVADVPGMPLRLEPGEPMRQVAPYPADLIDLVAKLRYREGWTFNLVDVDRDQGSLGYTLIIDITCADSYHPDRQRRVLHYMLVPPASFNRRSWQRWLLEQCLLVEQHEACEFFTIEGEGKPYAPSHGPGNDPYTIRELSTETDVRTSFRGEVKP